MFTHGLYRLTKLWSTKQIGGHLCCLKLEEKQNLKLQEGPQTKWGDPWTTVGEHEMIHSLFIWSCSAASSSGAVLDQAHAFLALGRAPRSRGGFHHPLAMLGFHLPLALASMADVQGWQELKYSISKETLLYLCSSLSSTSSSPGRLHVYIESLAPMLGKQSSLHGKG